MSAALSYSLYLVLGKKLIAGIGSLLFTCIAMLASTVFVTLHYSTQHAIQDLFNEPDAPTSIVGTAGPVFCPVGLSG